MGLTHDYSIILLGEENSLIHHALSEHIHGEGLSLCMEWPHISLGHSIRI